jgi:hypothetical protein
MATQAQAMNGAPLTRELVTGEILRNTGLNATALSGTSNPSSVYQMMLSGSPAAMPLYRALEEKDTAINSALAMRRALVLGRDRNIESANRDDGQAQLYADEAARFLADIAGFRTALWEMLDAPAYGFAVAEILWRIDPQGIRAGRRSCSVLAIRATRRPANSVSRRWPAPGASRFRRISFWSPPINRVMAIAAACRFCANCFCSPGSSAT